MDKMVIFQFFASFYFPNFYFGLWGFIKMLDWFWGDDSALEMRRDHRDHSFSRLLFDPWSSFDSFLAFGYIIWFIRIYQIYPIIRYIQFYLSKIYESCIDLHGFFHGHPIRKIFPTGQVFNLFLARHCDKNPPWAKESDGDGNMGWTISPPIFSRIFPATPRFKGKTCP